MKQIIEHTLIFLEKADDWMTPEEITTEIHAVFPKADTKPVFTRLRQLAHIGKEAGLGYRWYEPNELTDHVQECLDRGEDW